MGSLNCKQMYFPIKYVQDYKLSRIVQIYTTPNLSRIEDHLSMNHLTCFCVIQ
jgi:hypothetical protein